MDLPERVLRGCVTSRMVKYLYYKYNHYNHYLFYNLLLIKIIHIHISFSA